MVEDVKQRDIDHIARELYAISLQAMTGLNLDDVETYDTASYQVLTAQAKYVLLKIIAEKIKVHEMYVAAEYHDAASIDSEAEINKLKKELTELEKI